MESNLCYIFKGFPPTINLNDITDSFSKNEIYLHQPRRMGDNTIQVLMKQSDYERLNFSDLKWNGIHQITIHPKQ